MRLPRIALVLSAAGWIPAAANAQGNVAAQTHTAADQIVCPLQELEWGVAQSLPDPWWAPSYKAPYAHGPTTWGTVGGKETLACRYEFAARSQMHNLPQTEGTTWPEFTGRGQIFVIRPTNTSIPQSQWPCPASIQVRAISALPRPWIATYHMWPLTDKWSHNPNLIGAAYDVCEYTEPQQAGAWTQPVLILYSLEGPPGPVAQTGMTGLAGNPTGRPVMDNLAQTFLVTKAQLNAIPAVRTTSCPTTVRFEGRIGANVAGKVTWRSEINGQQGSLQTLTFTSPGEKVVKFETQVDLAQQAGGPLALATQIQPANVVTGQARIVIASPTGGVSESEFAKYQITCTPKAPAGDLAQMPTPPDPPPPSAPQAIAQPQPTAQEPLSVAATPSQPPRRVAARATTTESDAIAAAALPDLRIAAAELNRARPTMVRVQVVNSGQGPSPATRLRVWTSDGKSWNAVVPALTSGQETWVVVRADVALATAANVLAKVDDPDRVKESDEDNNEFTIK